VATSVWLFKPRSHGRKKEGARARNGAPLPGRVPSFLLAPSIGVFGFVPVWARSIFSSSCVVVRAWCLVPGVRRCRFGRRCYASACGVRGARCGVLVRGAAPWLWLLLRRRVCCDSRGDGRAWRGGCARGGCVARALGVMEGWGWRPVVAAGGALCRLCGRCACGSPVSVLEMSLMPLQAVGAVVTAVPPWCVVRVYGVADGPRGTAARGAVAVLAWRWR
jgi:hypothetical protein